MQLLRRVFSPYPRSWKVHKLALTTGAFVGFFIAYFQPFGLHNLLYSSKLFLLLGYGVVTTACIYLFSGGLPFLFPTLFRENSWNVLKQILFLLALVLIIGIVNYAYSLFFSVFPWIGFSGLFTFLVYTLSVAIFPIAAVTFITHAVYFNQHTRESSVIDNMLKQPAVEHQQSTVSIDFENGNTVFSLPENEIIYLESEGNYLRIFHTTKGELKNTLVRTTLKQVFESLGSENLFRCHRAYAINIEQVIGVKGNSQGYKLSVEKSSFEIPVSRSNSKEFKSKMQKLKRIEGSKNQI